MKWHFFGVDMMMANNLKRLSSEERAEIREKFTEVRILQLIHLTEINPWDQDYAVKFIQRLGRS